MTGPLGDMAELHEIWAAASRVDHQFALPWEPTYDETLRAALADLDQADAVLDSAHPRAS